MKKAVVKPGVKPHTKQAVQGHKNHDLFFSSIQFQLGIYSPQA